MFQEFPYTDMHQLNLDWIIKIAKDFLDQYTHIQDLISDGEQSLTDLIGEGEQSLTDLTSAGLTQLQEKADNLESLLQEWYNTHSSDIANQLASALAEITQTTTTLLNNAIISFNNNADTKTANSIASIPSDYTALFNQVQNINDMLINVVIEGATVPTNSAATATTTTLDMSRKNYVTITNTSDSAGYFSPSIFMDDVDKQDYFNVLIEPGDSHTFTLPGISTDNDNGLWEWLGGDYYTNHTFNLGFRNINSRSATFTLYNFIADEPLKNNIITVTKDPVPGCFCDIVSALAYANLKVDVLNDPVTIFVTNGIYQLYTVTSRIAVIDKGANKINIIGESKENTIFRLTNTYPNNNQIMNIGGPCIIKNLSLYNFADGSEPSLSHNPYCLHNDTSYSTTAKYATIVENCVFYSEMFNPVGAGLRHRQKQVYRNVTTVYANSYISSGNGSLYIHSQGDANDTPAGLEIIECCLVCQNDRECVNLPNVHPDDYRSIPVRFLKNTGWTSGTYPHYLSPANFNFSPDTDLNGFIGSAPYYYNLP